MSDNWDTQQICEWEPSDNKDHESDRASCRDDLHRPGIPKHGNTIGRWDEIIGDRNQWELMAALIAETSFMMPTWPEKIQYTLWSSKNKQRRLNSAATAVQIVKCNKYHTKTNWKQLTFVGP